MALPSTIRRFEVDLSDVENHVYETLSLRVAQHPSETDEYLLTRLIAYCLNVSKGVEMSKSGLCNADEPPLWSHDLTGQMELWIDVGLPASDRIHKASKRSQQVLIYTQKGIERVREKLNAKLIYKSSDVLIYPLDISALNELQQSLARVNHWSLIHSEGTLFITSGDVNVALEIRAHHIEAPEVD